MMGCLVGDSPCSGAGGGAGGPQIGQDLAGTHAVEEEWDVVHVGCPAVNIRVVALLDC